jgi:hypothetical protein
MELKRDTVKLSNTVTLDQLKDLSIDVHVRFKASNEEPK